LSGDQANEKAVVLTAQRERRVFIGVGGVGVPRQTGHLGSGGLRYLHKCSASTLWFTKVPENDKLFGFVKRESLHAAPFLGRASFNWPIKRQCAVRATSLRLNT
jgi:hypothetical protein